MSYNDTSLGTIARRSASVYADSVCFLACQQCVDARTSLCFLGHTHSVHVSTKLCLCLVATSCRSPDRSRLRVHECHRKLRESYTSSKLVALRPTSGSDCRDDKGFARTLCFRLRLYCTSEDGQLERDSERAHSSDEHGSSVAKSIVSSAWSQLGCQSPRLTSLMPFSSS